MLYSNDDLYYRLGYNIVKHRAKTTATPLYKKLVKGKREEIIAWAKETREPILLEEKEIIKREEWDLVGLVGASEKQLLHPHYKIMESCFFTNFAPTSSTAVVMLCANAKPYRKHFLIKSYYEEAKKHGADFFILSNPGVIPIEFDNYYPFRWYEWDETLETPEIKALYTKVLTERIVNWFTRFSSYKNIVSVVRPGETHQALLEAQKVLKQQFYFLFTEEFMQKIYDTWLEKFCGRKYFLKSRLMQLTMTREEYKKILLEAINGSVS